MHTASPALLHNSGTVPSDLAMHTHTRMHTYKSNCKRTKTEEKYIYTTAQSKYVEEKKMPIKHAPIACNLPIIRYTNRVRCICDCPKRMDALTSKCDHPTKKKSPICELREIKQHNACKQQKSRSREFAIVH